jgi:hypothetical protein
MLHVACCMLHVVVWEVKELTAYVPLPQTMLTAFESTTAVFAIFFYGMK